jgi:ubiquinone biosynthesis protein
LAVTIDPKKCSVRRAVPRLMQILGVLARRKYLGALLGKRHWPPPKEVRETFEELGLTFLKLGQVLAMRRDLLPDAYIDELELLHDELPAMGVDEVRATVEVELGAPLTELFASFSEIPLAAATIAQVHEATLQGGRHVTSAPCLSVCCCEMRMFAWERDGRPKRGRTLASNPRNRCAATERPLHESRQVGD